MYKCFANNTQNAKIYRTGVCIACRKGFFMIKVQLKDGEIKEFEAGISAFDAARELGLAKTPALRKSTARSAI